MFSTLCFTPLPQPPNLPKKCSVVRAQHSIVRVQHSKVGRSCSKDCLIGRLTILVLCLWQAMSDQVIQHDQWYFFFVSRPGQLGLWISHNVECGHKMKKIHDQGGRVEQIAPLTLCWSWYFHFYHDQSFEVVAHFIVPPCSSLCVEWYLVSRTYICMSHVSDFVNC